MTINRSTVVPGILDRDLWQFGIELPSQASDQRELAERRAREALKPAKPQKPCDLGLFSDDAAQLDLVDMARRSK